MNIVRLNDIAQLDDFYCGVSAFDNFIHSKGLARSVENNFCVPYKVMIGAKIVAFFALSCGSLSLDEDSKDDFFDGYTNAGNVSVPESYKDTLRNKSHYPSIDLAYLAVRDEYRGRHIGYDIVKVIEEKIKVSFDFAGCQFVTLDAYHTEDYSTLRFYEKCGYTKCQFPTAWSDTVRMYKPLIG